MILDNWKNIILSETEDDIYRESLDTNAKLKKVSNWKLGDTPTHWNRFTENVLPANSHSETNRYLRSLSFAKEKLTENKKENFKAMFEKLLEDADLTMGGYTGDEKTSVSDKGFFYFDLDESLSVEFDPDTKEWYIQYVYDDNWEDVLEYGDVDDVVRLDGNGWDSLIDSLFDNTMFIFGSLNKEDYYLSKKESKINKISRLREEYEDDVMSDETYQKVCAFFKEKYDWDITKKDIQDKTTDCYDSLRNKTYRDIPRKPSLGGVIFQANYNYFNCAIIDKETEPFSIKPAYTQDASFFDLLSLLKSLGEKYNKAIKVIYLDMSDSYAHKVKIKLYIARPTVSMEGIDIPDFIEEGSYHSMIGDCYGIRIPKSKFMTKSFQKKLTDFLDSYTPKYEESLNALSFVTPVKNAYYEVFFNRGNNICFTVKSSYYRENVIEYLKSTYSTDSTANGIYTFILYTKRYTLESLKEAYEEIISILRSRRNAKTIIPNDNRNDFVALWLTKLTKEQILSCGGLIVTIDKYGELGYTFGARQRFNYTKGSDWKAYQDIDEYNYSDKMVINPYKFLKIPREQQLSYLKKGLSQVGYNPEKGSKRINPQSFYSFYKGVIKKCREAISYVKTRYSYSRNYKEKKRIENERLI